MKLTLKATPRSQFNRKRWNSILGHFREPSKGCTFERLQDARDPQLLGTIELHTLDGLRELERATFHALVISGDTITFGT